MRDRDVCAVCGAEQKIFADFGFGMHMVTRVQLESYKGPLKGVTYTLTHMSWCYTTDARNQRYRVDL